MSIVIRRAGTIASVLCAGLAWGCKAPPIPDPGESAVQAVQAPAIPAKWEGEVVFSEMEADLGKVERGEQATHGFTVTNKTNRVLNIENVRGS